MTKAEKYLEQIDCENTNYLLYGKPITLAQILDDYHKEQLADNEDKVSVLCACGGSERMALDSTMNPCKHPKYFKG